MTTPPITPAEPQALREGLRQLGFYGLLEHWEAVAFAAWLPELVAWEQASRQRRSLERRLRNARLGRFKPLADFDRSGPKKIDREQIEDLLTLRFPARGLFPSLRSHSTEIQLSDLRGPPREVPLESPIPSPEGT